MEDEIGGFRDDFVVRFDCCGERNFETFFAHFLRNPFRTFGEQACGVASLWTFGDSPFDHTLEGAEEGQALCLCDRRIAEAGCRALVAHRTEGSGSDEQGVAITVGTNLIELEKMAGRLALFPQAWTC
jgi:hypothetical protein